MSEKIDFLNSNVGIVHQFQTVADRLIIPVGSSGRITNSLEAFFERMKTDRTAEAFLSINAVTYDLGEILQLFYEWLLCSEPLKQSLIDATARLLKAMEIKTPFTHDAEGNNQLGRLFVWLDRGERLAAASELPIKDVTSKVKEYTGRASRKDRTEPEGPLDNPKATMHIFEYKRRVGNVELTYFYWMLKWDKSKIGEETDSLEKAAEAVYRCFYKNMSNLKLQDSLNPGHNKWIVLLGNWVTADDLKALKRKDHVLVIPDLATDDRDGQMFVLNYPSASKQKERVLPKDIRRTRAAHKGSVNAMDYTVDLKSGTKIESSMDWYLYRPEDRTLGEMYCANCNNVGIVANAGMCYVRGHGLLCGPCINWKLENENLDDSLYDLSGG